MMAYRATPHTTTKLSPNTVMLGTVTRLPQVLYPRPDPKPISEYVHHVSDTLHNTYSTMKYAHTETTAYDPLIHGKYTEGDTVWVLEAKSKLNKSDKFSTRYYGPFLVAKVVDYDTYIIASKNRSEKNRTSQLSETS